MKNSYVMESSIEEFVEGDVVYVANYKYSASEEVIQVFICSFLHFSFTTWCYLLIFITGKGKKSASTRRVFCSST